MRIGPEPTTDTFMSIMHGTHPHTIPGNALAVDPNYQFETLSRYGNNFLNKFEGASLDNQASCLFVCLLFSLLLLKVCYFVYLFVLLVS